MHSEEVRQVLAENALTEGDGELPIDARFGRTEAGEGGGVEGNLLEEELVFALAQIRAMGEAERRDGRDGAVRVPFVNSVIYGSCQRLRFFCLFVLRRGFCCTNG